MVSTVPICWRTRRRCPCCVARRSACFLRSRVRKISTATSSSSSIRSTGRRMPVVAFRISRRRCAPLTPMGHWSHWSRITGNPCAGGRFEEEGRGGTVNEWSRRSFARGRTQWLASQGRCRSTRAGGSTERSGRRPSISVWSPTELSMRSSTARSMLTACGITPVRLSCVAKWGSRFVMRKHAS